MPCYVCSQRKEPGLRLDQAPREALQCLLSLKGRSHTAPPCRKMKQKPGAGKCGQNSHRYKDLNLRPALVQTTPCQRQSHLIQRRHLPGTWVTPGTLRTLTWCMRTSVRLMGDKQEVLTRCTVDTYTVVSEPLLSCLAPETPSLDRWSD